MKLYAYCLSDEVTASTVESEIGLASAPPRLIRCGGISAVVSDLDESQVIVTRENVLAHERVVRRVLVETTPLPFRFGTIVSERELQSYVNSQQASLMAQLARVRGCVEMSVKVIWNKDTIRHEDERPKTQAEAQGGAGQIVKGSGTAFLLAKRREILGDERLKRRAEELAAWLAGCLEDVVREAQISLQPAETLFLSAAHLVERARLDEYRKALRRARREQSELHFLTSGAWPPYSFTSAGS